jgi:hypothetical protein
MPPEVRAMQRHLRQEFDLSPKGRPIPWPILCTLAMSAGFILAYAGFILAYIVFQLAILVANAL